jgi:Ca-activated chloride channel homolog
VPRRPWQALAPYFLLAVIAVPLGLALHTQISLATGGQSIRWERPLALLLLAGVALVAWVAFHLRRARASTLAFSSVAALALTRRGWVAQLASLPDVLRVLAIGLIAVALARPQTFRMEEIEVESIDIMIVLDLSKSMEERDLGRDRLDAGQRTIRTFLRQIEHDRVGLVVFAEAAMLQCPLTHDHSALDQIVADLAIGDVPEMGTAIGDSLALALASLRRSDARSKVVILLSDGDSNMTREFTPRQAKDQAQAMGVKVFTILLGREGGSLFGTRYAVNPELLQEIARDTGGAFFRAGDDRALARSFHRVRQTLETSRRRVKGRILGAELFPWLAVTAFVLLLIEILMRLTRWRRFP